jgi:hypothetical protein
MAIRYWPVSTLVAVLNFAVAYFESVPFGTDSLCHRPLAFFITETALGLGD